MFFSNSNTPIKKSVMDRAKTNIMVKNSLFNYTSHISLVMCKNNSPFKNWREQICHPLTITLSKNNLSFIPISQNIYYPVNGPKGTPCWFMNKITITMER